MERTLKKIFRVADDGFGWIEEESDYVDNRMFITVQKPYTLVHPPNPNWRPFFDWETETWSETATLEEMDVGENLPDPYKVMQEQAELIEKLMRDSRKG